MNRDNIKNIQIRDYLKSRGFYPAREYSGYGMYRSPFRDDSTPSLKIDYSKNLWYDFGSDEGGSIIDLVMKLEGCTFNDAIEHLREQPLIPMEEQLSLSFHRNPERNSGITLMEDKPLEHPRLLEYLQIRKINADIALEQCREIHYSAAGNIYYAIGFANDAGGYELRNPAFKGCIAPKDITRIRQESGKESCFVFEGFMDYLSLLTIRKQLNPEYPSSNRHDSIILNSTANQQKALPLLADYQQIHCFFDNDKAGMTVFRKLQKELGCRVRNSSHHYSGYKDLNEYLCAGAHLKHSRSPKQPVQKPKRGLGI
ncbi:MAG: DNA primase [Petrimonas sp.]|uniref:toprim domain-containing protein n=1 Tax=Petrimonas sp. TaxID=2023866 RepID=UPI0030D539AF